MTASRCAAALLLLFPAVAAADPPRGEIDGTIERAGKSLPWRAWIPPDARDMPLLVGLHGRSRHMDQYRYYFLDVGKSAPAGTPVAVVAPKLDWDAPWIETQRLLFALIDDLTARYPIDRARVAVMGFSMGASSALHLARHNPSRFSAVWAASGLFPDDALAQLRRRSTRVILSWSGTPGQCAHTEELARLVDRGRAEARAVVFRGGRHEPHMEMFRDADLLRWFVGTTVSAPTADRRP